MFSTFESFTNTMSKSRGAQIFGLVIIVAFIGLWIFSKFSDPRTQKTQATVIDVSCRYSLVHKRTICTAQITYQVDGKEYNNAIVVGPLTSKTVTVKYDPKNPKNVTYAGIF